MDDTLRNRLWNCLCQCYWDTRPSSRHTPEDPLGRLVTRLWDEFLNRPLDTLGDHWPRTYAEMRTWFFSSEWDEVYRFVQFVSDTHSDPGRNAWFGLQCNRVLEEELSAYRFVNGLITEVTAEEEIAAVEEALAATRRVPPVQVHLRKAQEHLADRRNPDYRNSIKESISAVESLLAQQTGEKGFAAALKALEGPLGLHGAQKGAFEKLYGYTSDAQGIRHALMAEPGLTFEDAKYMWVVCSAFVNFLTARATAVGLPRPR